MLKETGGRTHWDANAWTACTVRHLGAPYDSEPLPPRPTRGTQPIEEAWCRTPDPLNTRVSGGIPRYPTLPLTGGETESHSSLALPTQYDSLRRVLDAAS